jgi:serine/threonine protein kinase
LGFGGMSVVYLAQDQRLNRKVALKLLASSLAEDEAFRDRFLRESQLAASIDHPNIVPIYEAGATDDLLFIAMRYALVIAAVPVSKVEEARSASLRLLRQVSQFANAIPALR